MFYKEAPSVRLQINRGAVSRPGVRARPKCSSLTKKNVEAIFCCLIWEGHCSVLRRSSMIDGVVAVHRNVNRG